ncbi:hypothetical protein BDZ89DRAFT_345658 [Hymenopellis radicata]|nr:hypothetical protein BDZ89DRAFT_345658 [Hymenopellis radicata]
MIVTNRKATTTDQLVYAPAGSNNQASAQPPSASKSQDSQPSPKGRRRSFFFGLFSSSAADKPAPHRASTGTKLTKVQSPPAASKQPVIRSLSPDLLRDPAFSSDPQSHLFNVGRRSPGDAGVKPAQLQPVVTGQQHQIWRPPLSPTHSPSNSPPSSVPNHSFSSASVSLQTASSSSPSTTIPSQEADNRSPEPIPQPEAHYKLRLLNPDPDEPPPYEDTGVARPIEKKAKPSLEVTDESVVTPSTSLTASSSAPQPHLSIPTVSGQPEESPVDVPSSLSFLKPSARR